MRVESIGAGWVAFSPLSGETLLLNDEAAAILEILEQGPAEPDAVCAVLARESGVDAAEIGERIRESWTLLAQAGLVRLSPAVDPAP